MSEDTPKDATATEATAQPQDAADAAAGQQAEAGPQTMDDAFASLSPDRQNSFRLLRIVGAHLLAWLAVMGLFAAADSWRMLTDISLASLLAIAAGALAGVTTTTLIHEWGHFFGAQRSGGQFTIPRKVGVFVYDWDFKRNSVDQFMTMSKAGTIGGAVSLALIWLLLPPETLARAAVFAGGVAGFAFAARIEWPVLRAVRDGADPLQELSRINEYVLRQSVIVATLAGLAALWVVAP
ncbi:MAG: hypothetical protein NXI15_07240 [Gammaproteobacteria bacterium]|nr:hypothetical protein [Gammaproteobacteria bacterium]